MALRWEIPHKSPYGNGGIGVQKVYWVLLVVPLVSYLFLFVPVLYLF